MWHPPPPVRGVGRFGGMPLTEQLELLPPDTIIADQEVGVHQRCIDPCISRSEIERGD